MNDFDWENISESDKKKIQAYVLAMSTEGNPDLPSAILESENKALETENKSVIGAINEVNKRSKVAYNGTVNFNERFNTVIGDETDSSLEAFKFIKEKLGGNVLNAFLNIQETVKETNNTLTEVKNNSTKVVAGSISVQEFQQIIQDENV